MAHKLAGRKTPEKDDPSTNESGKANSKGLLNRREYVKLGAAATAVVLGTNTGVGADPTDGNGESYVTDFSEYAQ